MDEIDILIIDLFCQMTAKQKSEIIDFASSLIASEQEEAASVLQ